MNLDSFIQFLGDLNPLIGAPLVALLAMAVSVVALGAYKLVKEFLPW